MSVKATKRLVARMERSARPAARDPGADAAATLAVSDGRAGNARQADALARAVGMEPVRTQVLASRLPWRAWAPLLGPGSAHAFGHDFAMQLAHPPRLAIGCGRQAALATRLLRTHGTRVVQILDPRLDPRHWDLVVAPQHDGLQGDNVLSTVGSLHPVDDLWLAQGRAVFQAFAHLPRPRTTVLLGASSRHAPLDRAAFMRIAALLDRNRENSGGSVMLTASRRTPTALRAALRRRFAQVPGSAWLGPEDGTNPYAGLLGWADRIVCSPDSVNMISEACATTVPVYVFEPERARGRLRLFLDTLLRSGRIRPLDAAMSPFDVSPLRETARVAADVRRRLGF
jgi:mitochondrial fission protein ELM1